MEKDFPQTDLINNRSREQLAWVLERQLEHYMATEALPLIDADRRACLIEIRETVALLSATFPRQAKRKAVKEEEALPELSEDQQAEMDKLDKEKAKHGSRPRTVT